MSGESAPVGAPSPRSSSYEGRLVIVMGTHKASAFSFELNEKNPFLPAFEPKSPFALPADEVAADAPEGSYTYQLVQSGPAVPAEECETPVAAVEVMIRWGATVLHVAHLSPVSSFFVGEDEGKGRKSDFFLPEEKLGARRLPLVLADRGSVYLVVPAGATGTLTLAGAPAQRVRDLIASGAAEPCAAAPGAHRIALPDGAAAALDLNGLSFEVSAVRAGRTTRRIKLDGESLPYTGLSLLLHASVLAAAALFMPSMAMADEDGISLDQQVEMYALLESHSVPEPDQARDDARTAEPGEHGDVGQAGPGEAGKAGSEASRASNHRFGVKGDGREESLSRRADLVRDAEGFGAIGLLNGLNGSMGPISAFGSDLASGADPMNGRGNMFGETIGDAMGMGGLTLSGLGEGGGNPFGVIGVGRIGTIGHDFAGGPGHPGGLVGGRHQAKPPIVRIGQTLSSGRLPPEIIQRVIRQSFGRFRACYESGLRGNPNLQGRVAVRFVIGRDGAVSNVGNGGSDLPDAGVVSCVARAFYGLSFPAPDSGIVTVTYPIVFSPAN